MVKKFEKGDIIIADFDPQVGHEQCGRRPALVISNDFFNQKTPFVIACPITSRERPHPLHVQLDERTEIKGMILVEHVKAIDVQARKAKFVEKLPDDIMDEVTELLLESI